MTPEVAELLRKAKLTPAAGMRTTDGYRIISGPHRSDLLPGLPSGVWLAAESVHVEPALDLRVEHEVGDIDLADRATFLLCVDELARRGLSKVPCWCGCQMDFPLHSLYNLDDWSLDGPGIAFAVARALAYSAPGEMRP